MRDDELSRIAQASSAKAEQITPLLHDPSPNVIRKLVENTNLSDDHVLVLAARKNLPQDILAALAKDVRWSGSYPVQRALATNPKTPLSVSISLMRYLRLFDLAHMTRDPHVLPAVRRKAEALVMERIPTMPLGLKKSLARITVGNVLLKLLQESDREVILSCLSNPRLVEAHLYKIISRKETGANTIRIIAAHPTWSIRPSVRFALVRNAHTPLPMTERFLRSLKLSELRDLSIDRSLSVSIKPLIHRELVRRGIDPDIREGDVIFEADEHDETVLDEFTGDGGSKDETEE